MNCSLGECNEALLGTAVLLSDTDGEGIPWQEGGFNVYNSMSEDGEKQFVLLHPNCFLSVFQQLTETEGMTALTLVYGPVGMIQDELQIP